MYSLVVLNKAKRDIQKLKKRDANVGKKIEKVLYKLAINPFEIGLKTHKVKTKMNGSVYSTRITGDLRIIWKFEGGKIILVLAIGGHSGKHSVY